MYLLNLILVIFMFFSGLFVFCSKRKHLLLMLLSLEFIILSLYMMLFIYLSMYDYEFYFSMMFITFCVCESVPIILEHKTSKNHTFQCKKQNYCKLFYYQNYLIST